MNSDPIVKQTLLILVGLFGSILILTIILDLKKRKDQLVKGLGELWLRYISFLFIAPIFLGFAYLGKPLFNFLVVVMAAMYLKEFFGITRVWQHAVYRWEGRIFAQVPLNKFEEVFAYAVKKMRFPALSAITGLDRQPRACPRILRWRHRAVGPRQPAQRRQPCIALRAGHQSNLSGPGQPL